MAKMTLMCSISAVLTVVLLSIMSDSVTADCCYKVTNCCCRDGTAGTPYCGVGRCNIFGCNCRGGCRQGPIGRNVTSTGVPPVVTKFLDSIPVEDNLAWELGYLVGETMQLINDEI
jgi:hypothetical protein